MKQTITQRYKEFKILLQESFVDFVNSVILDIFIYYPVRAYYLFKYWRANEIHIVWRWDGRIPPFFLCSHDVFTTNKDLELAVLRNEVEPDTFVEEALRATKGCKFIIFEASEDEYVQFWLGNGSYELSFPLSEGTSHPNYYHDIIAALSLHGFSRFIPSKKQKEMGFDQYRVDWQKPVMGTGPANDAEDKSDDEIEDGVIYIDEITADFGSNRRNAATVANYIFTSVFEDDLENVRTRVG